MVRLNFIIKFHDEVLKENYYLFLRSSKLWSDMNFINTRIFALDGQEFYFESKEIDHGSEKQLKTRLRDKLQSFTEEQAKILVLGELDKVFGIREFQGKLLNYTISYIEESKRSGELTYYLHFFYRITELPQVERLINLENIELVSETLLSKLSEKDFKLHENYQISQVIYKFFTSNLWKKELNYFIRPKDKPKKKTIAVLFSDLKDFGNLVQEHEAKYPPFTKELIKQYQHECSYFIKYNGGYVVQTSGDAFMAIFDLSQNVEEDLFAVLKAAIGILSIPKITVNKVNINVTTRIGINIAEVEEGYIGAPDLREYTVFGKDVNIASRLEKKIEELSKEISNFSGGILCNIEKLNEKFTNDVEQNINKLFNSLYEEIKKAPPWLASTLIKSIEEKKNLVSILPSFHRLKSKIQSHLNSQKKAKFQINTNPELIPIQTKEGMTYCIFVYKVV